MKHGGSPPGGEPAGNDPADASEVRIGHAVSSFLKPAKDTVNPLRIPRSMGWGSIQRETAGHHRGRKRGTAIR